MSATCASSVMSNPRPAHTIADPLSRLASHSSHTSSTHACSQDIMEVKVSSVLGVAMLRERVDETYCSWKK